MIYVPTAIDYKTMKTNTPFRHRLKTPETPD